MLRSLAVTWVVVAAVSSVTTTVAAAEPVEETETIDFSTQVQPILSDRCFHCHGPDADNQDSAFRADTKENLFADLGGYSAIVPGDLAASELHLRIHSSDPDMVMPPPDSKRALSAEDKRILDAWITQGAPYAEHWAFVPPQRPQPPTGVMYDSHHPIDAFVARRLQREGLAMSPPADPATMLRRASLTLTGLLPPPDLQQRYLASPTDAAYEAAVDELLRSMAYAERQSLRWLDASRYADTDGYQNDNERTNWPYRDWVTQAFHDNMPFDQFTIEQIAGDMLPGATESQRLASAFNRNHRQNGEAGALADEFFVENVIDRVETTAAVWLGLTAGCARCHDHKYDPLSQREFYQLYAYFNNIGERGVGGGVSANPTMKTYSPLVKMPAELAASLRATEESIAEARQSLDERLNEWAHSLAAGLTDELDDWTIADIRSHELDGAGRFDQIDDLTLLYTGSGSRDVTYRVGINAAGQTLTALMIEALPDGRFAMPRQLAPSSNGNFVLTDFSLTLNGAAVKIASIAASFEQDNYPVKNAIDGDLKSGWAVFGSGVKAEPVQAVVKFAEPLVVTKSDKLDVKLFFGGDFPSHSIGKLRLKLTQAVDGSLPTTFGLGDQVLAAIRKPAESRSDNDRNQIRSHYETIDASLLAAMAAKKSVESELVKRGLQQVTVMVMQEQEGEPAAAYLLQRGAYDAPDTSAPLPRGVPAALLSGESNRQPQDRLELARWLVAADNPLTARVTVNRMWQDHFGVGLVKTTEDFGLQGEVPVHPELLDWLASAFVRSGWDVRAMHRLIVTSKAYRQSSKANDELNTLDPENRLLARGPRYRADGFVIRDIALQSSGLLATKVGGRSVKPYQPDGLWSVVAANLGTEYTLDSGDDLYRKSMYTYWKRAVNPPRQTIFDAGGREVCNVRVRRTNTPLQSLVLMNDPTFIEAARHLAERALKEVHQHDRDRLASMYRHALARSPSDTVLDVLEANAAFFGTYYASEPEQAAGLLKIGESSRDESLDVTRHAAMTATAHLIMNLDEFICIE